MSKTKKATKSTKSEKSTITKENEDKIISFYARELFDNTTLPQMLSIVQNEALKYAEEQIKGDKMPESNKLDILKRMLDFEKQVAEMEEKQNEKSEE